MAQPLTFAVEEAFVRVAFVNAINVSTQMKLFLANIVNATIFRVIATMAYCVLVLSMEFVNVVNVVAKWVGWDLIVPLSQSSDKTCIPQNDDEATV